MVGHHPSATALSLPTFLNLTLQTNFSQPSQELLRNISNMSEDTRHDTSMGAPIELAFPLPKAPQSKIHMRLIISPTSILLLLTTVHQGETAKPALGSFVYALPDVRTSLICLMAITNASPENQSGADLVHEHLHLRILRRPCYPNGQLVGQKNNETCLRWQLNELCQCRHGRHRRGGDGRLQENCGGGGGGGTALR